MKEVYYWKNVPETSDEISMMRRLVIPLAMLALALTACDSTDPGGDANLTAVLVSPNGAEGAAILDVTGTVESFTAPSGMSVYTTPSGNGTRVIVVRLAPGELSVNLAVADASNPPAISVVEVADGNNQLRQSVSGYTVSFR